MIKIALALIVKGSDDEAVFLERLLKDTNQWVDGMFITSTYKKGQEHNKKVDEVCAQYGATMSYFEWCNDFAAARNFNFSQVTKDYDYILWADADDTFIWLKELRPTLEAHPEVDQWIMQYYYERDAYNNPTVVHSKEMVVKNDGCVKWFGKLHEHFQETRALNARYIDKIKRIHLTTDEHVEVAKKRNVEISKLDLKSRPHDPQAYFNLANSYIGSGNYEDARKTYKKFIDITGSEAEKYIAYQRLGLCEQNLGHKEESIKCLQISIGISPEFPDSYNQLGYMYFAYGNLEEAERYLLMGLIKKPQYQRMIVYNPRDYDYNPMMALAKVYFKKSRPDLALPMLKGCLGIYPDDPKIKALVDEMELETARLEKVVEAAKHIDTLNGDKEKILYTLNKLPQDLQSHPAISKIRNEYDIKTTSTGKDIAYYCGQTVFDWNPELFKTKGFGGSEEAVINLSREWAKAGYNVTVYNSCGLEPMKVDGVTYKPWWTFNAKDKWDHIILWRSPNLADFEFNSDNIYVDLHDVVAEGEFTKKRLSKIKKIFVKTKAHRVLFPKIPDEKFEIVPNGQDNSLFKEGVKRDPYLLINTSSPDRSMDVLPALFKEVKKRVPEARLAWAYGWNNFDQWYANDKRMMAWKDKVVTEMKEAGIEDRGRLPQHEVAKMYQEGSIMAYPSDFYEIDCISIKKAAAAGCIPVTTNFAAFDESNKYGVKVHTDRNKDNWVAPYQIGFGTKYKEAQKDWVDQVVLILSNVNKEIVERKEMMEWAKQFSWDKISARWTNIFK